MLQDPGEMKPSFLLPVLLFAFLSAANDDDEMECCPKKIVGGKTYILAGKLDKMKAMQYKCASPCLYTMDGDDKGKFCFKPGNQESKCSSPMLGFSTTPGFSTLIQGFSTTPAGSSPPFTSGGPGGSAGSEGLYAPQLNKDKIRCLIICIFLLFID